MAISNNKNLVAAYYDRAASHYYEKRDGYISSHQKNQIVAEVLNALNSFEGLGKRVLDLGCGPGLYAKEFTKRGYQYLGVDISTEVIEEAKASFRPTEDGIRAEFMVGDIENLSVPSASVDVVLAVWVLEYLDTDERAVREMHRVLKPGGIAVVVLNNRRSYNRAMRKLALSMAKMLPAKYTEWRHSCQHFAVRYHSPQKFSALMEDAGFSLVGDRYFDFNIVPFNMRMPGVYFHINQALSNLFSFANINLAFSRYIGIFRA